MTYHEANEGSFVATEQREPDTQAARGRWQLAAVAGGLILGYALREYEVSEGIDIISAAVGVIGAKNVLQGTLTILRDVYHQ